MAKFRTCVQIPLKVTGEKQKVEMQVAFFCLFTFRPGVKTITPLPCRVM